MAAGDAPGAFGKQIDDALEDLHHGDITLEQITKRVHVRGRGPDVIVMPEMPRISADIARGYLPSLLPDSAANPHPLPFFRDVVRVPHSVWAAHLIDAAGGPVSRARDEVIAFLRKRLQGEALFSPASIV